MSLIYTGSLQSQCLKCASIDSLDHLIMICNQRIEHLYNEKTKDTTMNYHGISEHMKRIKIWADTCSDSLISSPLIFYLNNCNHYLARLITTPKFYIAPFQYNDLKFLYTQMEISRNTLESAILYSGIMKEMGKSIDSLLNLKKQMRDTLQTMRSNIDLKFDNVTGCIESVDRKADTIDDGVKKNKTRLKWTLGITGATGVLTIVLLILTLTMK
jgi:hypothetical protein